MSRKDQGFNIIMRQGIIVIYCSTSRHPACSVMQSGTSQLYYQTLLTIKHENRKYGIIKNEVRNEKSKNFAELLFFASP